MITPFGTGVLFAEPKAGTVTNPTPYRFAFMQDAQVDIKGKNVKLRGRNQHASKIRRGEIDVSVKSKIASLDPNMLNQLYFGCPQATGIMLIADSEDGTIGGGAPAARVNTHNYAIGDLYSLAGFVYRCTTAGQSAGAPPALTQVIGVEAEDGAAIVICVEPTGSTVIVANSGTFAVDYGVRYKDSTKGAEFINSGLAAPLQGQYQCVSGAYNFNAADIAVAVKISYTYTAVRGVTVTLNNLPAGSAPDFKALLCDIDKDGKYFALELNDCVASDLSIPTKQGAFWVSDFAFDACADENEVVGHLYSDTF